MSRKEMQEIQDQMRENQGKKNALRNIRAIERQRKMPQNLESTELEHSKVRGGGMAGLSRVVGAGRKRVGRGRSPSSDSCSSMSSGEGGARRMGRMMFEHLSKLHGHKYAHKFMKGGAGGAPSAFAPMGLEVAHAPMTPAKFGLAGQALGGQDVPPGGMAPMAYGSAPQAPASFQRNSIALGSQGLLPSAQVGSGRKKHSAPSVHHTMNEMEGGVVMRRPGHALQQAVVAQPISGGKRAQRGAMISKLMREKGLTLGQASKYLKENGSA